MAPAPTPGSRAWWDGRAAIAGAEAEPMGARRSPRQGQHHRASEKIIQKVTTQGVGPFNTGGRDRASPNAGKIAGYDTHDVRATKTRAGPAAQSAARGGRDVPPRNSVCERICVIPRRAIRDRAALAQRCASNRHSGYEARSCHGGVRCRGAPAHNCFSTRSATNLPTHQPAWREHAMRAVRWGAATRWADTDRALALYCSNCQPVVVAWRTRPQPGRSRRGSTMIR